MPEAGINPFDRGRLSCAERLRLFWERALARAHVLYRRKPAVPDMKPAALDLSQAASREAGVDSGLKPVPADKDLPTQNEWLRHSIFGTQAEVAANPRTRRENGPAAPAFRAFEKRGAIRQKNFIERVDFQSGPGL